MSGDLEPFQRELGSVYSRAACTYDRVGPSPFRHFARRVVERTGIAPGGRILDVATGTGAMIVAAAEQAGPGAALVGVDLSHAMLQRAREATETAELRNVELRVMDAHDLEFPDESFDNVLCGFALGSIPNPALALREMGRVLRPAGRLGLVHAAGWFFQHDPRWTWQEDVFRRAGVQVAPYDARQALADLTGVLRRTGFIDAIVVEESCPLTFKDETEWWTWLWSHGSRRLVEQVPSDELPRLRHDLVSRLAKFHEDDGLIHGRLRAHVAVAGKPRYSSTSSSAARQVGGSP